MGRRLAPGGRLGETPPVSASLIEANRVLEHDVPALAAALSPLGRRVFLPPEGRDRPAAGAPPGVAAALDLPPEDLALALAPSPVNGLAELRRRWRLWQRRSAPPGVPSTLPVTTVGLAHGLSLLADLFGGEGKAVATPSPFWGNYRQAFATRTGARMLTAPAYVDGHYDPRALARALASLPDGEPAVAILNLPSNPGGYSPTVPERAELVASLVEVAERRPLVVLCDDAYAGLVFEEGVPAASPFWELAGAHPNLAPVKIDGGTKEFSFFGGRVGFVTFALDPGSEAAGAIEGKVRALVRATVGAPAAASQVVLLRALRSAWIEREVEAVRLLLAGRYRALDGALAAADPALLAVQPFNSGCFALVELPEGLDAHAVRKHLLSHHSTGLISIEPRYLRIAHCSVDAAALPELVRRLEHGVSELL